MDIEALIRERCEICHDVEQVYATTRSKERWEQTIDRMITYGAKLSKKERDIIIEYLLKTVK